VGNENTNDFWRVGVILRCVGERVEGRVASIIGVGSMGEEEQDHGEIPGASGFVEQSAVVAVVDSYERRVWR